jgi:hypothetical protein
MEQGFFGLTPSTVALVLIVTGLIFWAVWTWYYGGATVQAPSYKSGFIGGRTKQGHAIKEGFGAVNYGAGSPTCLRDSEEATALVSLFDDRKFFCPEAPDTLRELTVLCGKLACFKKDLMSAAHRVNATLKQEFMPTHDIEPISELTGRCFNTTVSPRDLELAFDKWTRRGEALVKKLSVSAKLECGEIDEAERLFKALMRDVIDVARGACLPGEQLINKKPGVRDAHPLEPPALVNYGEFSGYY